MLDWPAFGQALWDVSDKLGIRPEWQLPVLYLESQFDPASTNPYGCVGLNQFCPETYPGYVFVPVDEYKTWPASAQLSGPVATYWHTAMEFGSIRSATRLMLAQLGQAFLKSAPGLDSVIFRAPSGSYYSNCCTFDPGPLCSQNCARGPSKGYITVQDLANVVASRVRMPAVQNAIALAYQMRPGERMRDPVYGDDFMLIRPPAPRDNTGIAMVAALALAAAGGFAAIRARQYA